MNVISSPNAGHLIVVFGAGGIFFLLLGTFLIFVVAPDYKLAEQIMLTLTGSIFYLIASYGVYNYIRNVPEITVTLDNVVVKYVFKKKILIASEQIKTIHLSQKSDYLFLLVSTPIESTIIELNDGTQFVFFDSLYDQFGRVKLALNVFMSPNRHEDLIEIRKGRKVVKPIEDIDLKHEQFVSIRGNGILNIYGAMLIGFVVLAFSRMDSPNYLSPVLFSFIILLGIGFHLNYFRISDKYFQVKNHIWFWKTYTYRLGDIKEVIHELPSKSPESIRIRLKNHHTSGLQMAGSYREKDCVKLKEILEEHAIPFRSEYYG